MPVLFASLIACFMAKSAATKPIESLASKCKIELEYFFILNLGLGLIKFFLILSQYIFNLDNP